MSLAVYIGRFEPPHDAHLQTMQAALERHTRLLVLPGSANLARSMKNPWTAAERVQMLRAALLERGADLHRVRFHALADEFDSALWAQSVRDAVRQPVATLVGFEKDASSSYLRWFPEWQVEPAEGTPGLNATDLRAAYFEGREVTPVPDAVKAFLEHFKQSRLFLRLQAEHFAVLAERERLQGTPNPLQEIRFFEVQGDQIWLQKRTDHIGHGLWELPGHWLGPEETPPQLARIFDHPSRSLVRPSVAHVLQASGGGQPVALKLALSRPHRFFEDHHVIVRRMLEQ